MNKMRLPLTILCFAYLGTSFLSLVISLFSGVIMGNSSTINIMALINWLIGIAPFVFILLYGLGIKNKILMLISLILPLLNCTKDLLQLVVQGVKYLLADALVPFVQSYSVNMFTGIFGIAAYVLLILYLLNVYKNKTLSMIASIVYFALNFVLYLISGFSLIINRFIAGFFDEYALFFSVINLLGVLTVSLSCTVWLIYIKKALLNEE